MLRQWDSALLGVVKHRWPALVPREDIRTLESGPTKTDRSPLPRHLHCRSPQTLEDTRTSVPELLVVL